MKLHKVAVRNFRRLENVEIEFDEKETIFVGPNNSGKTTATVVFRCFLGSRDFKIHDFSMAKLSQIDAYNPDEEESELPEIELDLWFHFDPTSIEFGRIFALLPKLSDGLDQIGIRCCYRVKKAEELWRKYDDMFPVSSDGSRKRTLSHFLDIENNLKHHFEIAYFSLERDGDKTNPLPVDPNEGKGKLASLLRVDFVDAQRSMDDEETSRSNKLSAAFAAYYKRNYAQLKLREESVLIIDENNQRLTAHYKDSFQELFSIIAGLGVPSANDRDLKLVSSVSAETALKGSTDLMYVDATSQHELPEAYNGLGFKNLVYMAVQVRHYHLQWMNTEKNRPLCHLIAIEEPEVHLHAQVQQAFIANMWAVLNKDSGGGQLTTQLVITTHSSHVIDTVDFSKVRYFRRCHRAEDPETQKILNATEVHDLKKFIPESVGKGEENIPADEVLKFLKRYMTLTHCDLFFADGAILVEGSVERILLRPMIQKCIPELSSKYLSILEVGGAYAHRFVSLLEFLNIPYLVLTDIDSVKKQEGAKRATACPTTTEGAVTSNSALKFFFEGNDTISGLSVLDHGDHAQKNESRFVSFQKPVIAILKKTDFREKFELTLHGRTLEDTFIYENLDAIEAGTLSVGWELPDDLDTIQQNVYDFVQSSSFKKTEFALDVLSSSEWCVPLYISQGLHWIAGKLGIQTNEQ